jgi:Ran GTPase-activating protein (RanGAP) involved in mRNA processing and transport
LALSPHWTNLAGLNLDGCQIGDEGVRHLAGSPGMANLTSLGLHFAMVGVDGVRALAASPYLRNLRVLDLGGNALTDEAAEALAASPHLGQLRKLVLCQHPPISDTGRKALFDSPNLPNLIAVTFQYNVDEVVPRFVRR